MNKSKFLMVGAIAAVVLGLVGYAVYARHAAEPPGVSRAEARQAQADLRQLMQSKLHTEYTYMSFTIWHDKPLTADKMDGIAASSARVIQVAQGLDTYEPGYQKRRQLSKIAEELKRAAQEHDEPQVVNFFMHMDNTCQSCHKRFRPDLSWT
jgi:hypothetical protein